MKQQTVCSVVLVLIISAAVQAQSSRTPSLQDEGKLGFFIGTWSVEAEIKPGNAYGAPAGRYTYTEKYQWRPGGLLVQLRRSGHGPGGAIDQDVTLGYYLTTKQYSMIGRDLITGALMSGTGINDGDTWSFVDIAHLGQGRYVHERCTLTTTRVTAYTVKCETSPDAQRWTASFEGQATR
jgi:hypothetical protein